tara:strand:- start:411 stop:590 length:180 start_codon:yes stop_codon:yes gene_type:complete
MPFLDTRELFDDGEDGRHLKPLALHYADAVNTENLAERSVALENSATLRCSLPAYLSVA